MRSIIHELFRRSCPPPLIMMLMLTLTMLTMTMLTVTMPRWHGDNDGDDDSDDNDNGYGDDNDNDNYYVGDICKLRGSCKNVNRVTNSLPPFCTTRHKVAPIVMVTNSATRWRNLHGFQFWLPSGTTCISYKFATTWRHLHCHIALECPIGIIS